MKTHIYSCSNPYDEYSRQIYPIHINLVSHFEDISAHHPDGMITVNVETDNGLYCTCLKAYKSQKGFYCIFGKHRLYEGYIGNVEIVGAPLSLEDSLRSYGVKVNGK